MFSAVWNIKMKTGGLITLSRIQRYTGVYCLGVMHHLLYYIISFLMHAKDIYHELMKANLQVGRNIHAFKKNLH